MGVHEKAMTLLKTIYIETITKKRDSYTINHDTVISMSPSEKQTLLESTRYLKESNLIDDYGLCLGMLISCRLTRAGIRMVENIQDQPQPTANIVYGDNYGITGNNAVGNTFNTGTSFAQIQQLIQTTVQSQQEKDLLLKELDPLFQRLDNGFPVEKGILSQTKSILLKYQPLLSAVISAIMPYLLNK